MIQVDSIAFNYDPASATNDALNIRKNASAWVNVPEWQRGISVNPEDSPAAYAIAPTTGNTLHVQVSLSCTDPDLQSAEIRALDNVVYPPSQGGCLGVILDIIRALVQLLVGNVLGEVKARQVSFANGSTGPQLFDLINTKLANALVGVHTTEWRWQYRLGGGAWTDLPQVTKHRIYVVLDMPTAPWQQTPYNAGNKQLPWTDVLDFACNWAAGAKDKDAAAAGITRQVNALGPATVTYDCPGGGSSHYSWPFFDCTAFIDRLRGGTGQGIYVNCSDCATFTSSFSNVLGCDLWQSQMGTAFFQLNDILAIGSNTWQPPCQGIDGWHGGFGYHEVAWKGACDVNDNVFDACLKVDGDADPTTPPHTPLLPLNMRFGNPGDGDYRDKLCTPAGRPNCNPTPGTRTRRTVG
jgi:hypothetical protein